MDVDGVPLNQAFMPLPYRDVTGGFINIIQNVEQVSMRVGGTAETAVGEGRNDAPVGTTIALIEQAQKVINAVHKRMHAAQGKEFQLFKELFRRDPEAIWRNPPNPRFEMDRAKLMEALNNTDIVPKADPNTASQTMRIQKAIAIYTLAQQNPAAFDQKAVYTRIFDMIGVDDAQDLFSKAPPGPPPIDETKKMQAQAQMVGAQAKLLDASVKAKLGEATTGVKTADIQAKNQANLTKHAAAKAKAATDVLDVHGKLQLEKMRLKQSALIHGDELKQADIHKMADITHQHAQQNKEHSMQGLDLLHARQMADMDAAKQAQQSSVQHLHDVAMENQRAKIAQEAQFMVPEEGGE
jgi:hypothetical protein